jgi:hypothetical protein
MITESVAMPVRDTLREDILLATLSDSTQDNALRIRAARDLAFLRRMREGRLTQLSCLRLGPARILNMPGELFVEYQIIAQQMRPLDFVAMAAYGEYGMAYIGTEIAYRQGGYETGYASRVAPNVEAVLVPAIRKMLSVPAPPAR